VSVFGNPETKQRGAPKVSAVATFRISEHRHGNLGRPEAASQVLRKPPGSTPGLSGPIRRQSVPSTGGSLQVRLLHPQEDHSRFACFPFDSRWVTQGMSVKFDGLLVADVGSVGMKLVLVILMALAEGWTGPREGGTTRLGVSSRDTAWGNGPSWQMLRYRLPLALVALLSSAGCHRSTRLDGAERGPANQDGGATGVPDAEMCGKDGAPCPESPQCTDGETRERACASASQDMQTQTCVRGRWGEWPACPSATSCASGEHTRVCGLNGRGVEQGECVAGRWTRAGSCVDPDACVDRAFEQRSCAPNPGDKQQRECVRGAWGAWGECGTLEDCGDGSWMAVGTCPPLAECSNGSRESRPCGLNGRGTESRSCEQGAWGAFVCADPDVCTDDGTSSTACGLNARGVATLRCELGTWSTIACDDPDVCVDDSTRTTSWGMNGRGSCEASCTLGQWGLPGHCVEHDECWDGSSDSGACGLNDRGNHRRICDTGAWSVWSACEDPDECVDRASRERTCGTGSAGTADDLCEEGHWRLGECSTCADFDGDGHGIDCNAGADCDEGSARRYVGAEELDYSGVDEDCIDATGNDFLPVSGSALGGDTQAIATEAGLVYAGVGRELQVFAANQPELTLARVELRGIVRDVAVKDGFAYVALEQHGWGSDMAAVAVDLRDLERPGLPFYFSPGPVPSLAVSSGRLFVLRGSPVDYGWDGEVVVFDLSDPACPQPAGLSRRVWSVASAAWLRAGADRVYVFSTEYVDTLAADTLTLVERITLADLSSTERWLADLVVGHSRFIIGGSGAVYRVSGEADGRTTEEIARLTDPGTPPGAGMTVLTGSTLYVSGYDRLSAVDADGPPNLDPDAVKSWPVDASVREISPVDDVLYAATETGIERWKPTGSTLDRSARWGVHPSSDFVLAGSRAFVASPGRLMELDVSEPARPRVVWERSLVADVPRGLAVGEGYLVVHTSSSDGVLMTVVDLADPMHVREVELPFGSYEVEIVRRYDPSAKRFKPAAVFALDRGLGWVALDDEHFGASSWSRWGTPDGEWHPGHALAVRGTLLYVRDPRAAEYLGIVDLSQGDELPSRWVPFDAWPLAILFESSYGYVLRGDELVVFDFSNPYEPRALGRTDIDINDPRDLQKVGNRIYITNSDEFTWVDVRSPLAPAALRGFYISPLGTIAGAYAFVGHRSYGFGAQRLVGTW